MDRAAQSLPVRDWGGAADLRTAPAGPEETTIPPDPRLGAGSRRPAGWGPEALPSGLPEDLEGREAGRPSRGED